MKNIIFIFAFISFGLTSGILPLNAQSYKNDSYQLVGNSSKFEVKWMGYYSDPAFNSSRLTLEHAKFDTLKSLNKDQLMSFWEKNKHPKLWIGVVIRNIQGNTIPITIHTGNIEYCSFYGPKNWGDSPINGGYLRVPLKSPEIQFTIMPFESDTLFFSIENYVISPKDVQIFIGTSESIEKRKHDFREQEYIGWFIFQCGFLFLFIFSLINSIVNWFLLKRIEFIFYSMYLVTSIILFGTLSMEAWELSFASVISPGVPTFTIFYLKGLFIVYSICYFKFFSNYLDIRRNDDELNHYTTFIEIVQIGIVVIEIGLLFTNVSTQLRFQIFAAMGGFLAFIAIIYNIILIRKKGALLKTPEVRLMNGLAFLINFIMVPLTIYEMVWKGSLVGPVGVFFMQFGFLIESACFNWTTTRKTIRVEKKSLEEEQKKLKKEQELFNLRQELTDDFHDGMGDNIAKIINQSDSVIRNFGRENKALKDKLEEIKRFGGKIQDEYRVLLYLTNPENERLDILLDKIMKTARDIFDNANVNLDFNFQPPTVPLLFISAKQHKNLFFLIKETLTNTFKHAQAKNIVIYFKINEKTKEFDLTIEDDGIGFDTKHVQQGHGRTSAKHRAEAGGFLRQIESSIGNGTRISIHGIFDET